MPRYIEQSVDTVRMDKVRGLIIPGVGLGPSVLIERPYPLQRKPEGTLIALTANDVTRNLLISAHISTKQMD